MTREELPFGKALEKVAHRKNTFKEKPKIFGTIWKGYLPPLEESDL
jgi:hypothetical protein